MRIGVIGCGYVGLITGGCLAYLGHDVVIADIDKEKIDTLNSGGCPIFEPGLPEILQDIKQKEPVLSSADGGLQGKEPVQSAAGEERLRKGKVEFSNSVAHAIKNMDAVFIAVGTPEKKNGDADLCFVKKAALTIGKKLSSYTLIIIKSTVPVGTHILIKNCLLQNADPSLFSIVSNPEFLREGCAVKDFLEPDRIVIGSTNERAFAVMRELYKPLTDKGYKLFECDNATAEVIKYASNAFLAVKISFINEMARFCEKIDADALLVAKAMGMDKRIGHLFLEPGPGYGGSCFPKDTKALFHSSKKHKSLLNIVSAAIKTNKDHIIFCAKKIEDTLGSLSGKRIAMLGLSFKANTDDVRESPALMIASILIAKGASIIGYDPKAEATAKTALQDLITAKSAEEALNGCDCAVIATEWTEFREISPETFRNTLKNPIIFDLRNILRDKNLNEYNIRYIPLGRINKTES